MIYTVRIERTVYTILHVEATGVAHAMARAEMKCPATGSAWQVKGETCKVIGVSEDGKALSEPRGCQCLGLAHRNDCPEWVLPY